MATLLPFRGVRYNPKLMHQMANIITPPYDVIDEDLRQTLIESHPDNFAQLILPHGQGDSRYIIASNLLNQWKQAEVLVRDRFPCIYVYKISYQWGGREHSVLGFFGLLKLEEFGKGSIFPHENITDGPKDDRLKILERCRANLEPIYVLFPDPQGELDSVVEEAMLQAPRIRFRTQDGLGHQVWPYQDPRALDRLTTAMDRGQIYIADGHHRYNASLAYLGNLEEKFGPLDKSDPAKYILAFFVNMYHPGFRILPVNRLVKLPKPLDPDEWLGSISEKFESVWVPMPEFGDNPTYEVMERYLRPTEESPVRFGLLAGTRRFAVLEMRKKFAPTEADALKTPLETLHVRILHREILPRIPGLEAADVETKPRGLDYDADLGRTLQALKSGAADWALIMSPTRIDQVRQVANHRENMPPKSTYFFPKPASGLVLNCFDW